MIYVEHKDGTVTFIHFQAEDMGKTREELEQKGLVFDGLPIEPSVNESQILELRVNESNELYYGIREKEPTEIELLKKENAELKNSLADLWEVVLLGGAS